MIPDSTKDDILKAMKNFDAEYRGKPYWRGWKKKRQHKYAIFYMEKVYPVKMIIKMATDYPQAQFSGGREANLYIEKLGFQIKTLRERRDLIFTRLNEMEGINVYKPEAAFYIFPMIDLNQFKWKTDKEFVFDYLRQKHVLTVFGSGFGPYGENGFRMVYLPTLDEISIAMERLEELLKENRI